MGTRRATPKGAWIFGALQVFTAAWVLLPGGAWYPSQRAAVFGTGLLIVMAYGVWRGSEAAWVLACVFEVFSLLIFVFTPWPWDSTVWVTLLLTTGSLAALLSADVRRYVNTPRAARSAH